MPGSGEGAGDGGVADSLRPYAALVGVSKEKPVASGLGLGPKDRSLNPCHVQRSRGKGQGQGRGWSLRALAPPTSRGLLNSGCLPIPPAPV